MSRPVERRLGGAALVLALGALARAAEPPEELLRRSDLSSIGPQSFRARLQITARSRTLELEVWRSGETKLLVRFLDPAEKGKFLLRREGSLYLIAPRAKKPVKLTPDYRLSGAASLDEILGTRYSREYVVVSESSEGPDADLVALELEARSPGASYPTVRYIVRRSTHRPARADLRLASGKTARIVDFLEWMEAPRPHPSRLRVSDALNPKATADVQITEVEERPVPEGLFDLADDSERRKLDPGPR
jgi:hypothetical protein